MRPLTKIANGSFDNMHDEQLWPDSNAGWGLADAEVASPVWSDWKLLTNSPVLDGTRSLARSVGNTANLSPIYSNITGTKSFILIFYIYWPAVTEDHTHYVQLDAGDETIGIENVNTNEPTDSLTFKIFRSANGNPVLDIYRKLAGVFKSYSTEAIVKAGAERWLGLKIDYTDGDGAWDIKYNWDESTSFSSVHTPDTAPDNPLFGVNMTRLCLLIVNEGTGEEDESWFDKLSITDQTPTNVLSTAVGDLATDRFGFIDEIFTGLKADGSKADSNASKLIIQRKASDTGFATFEINNLDFTDFTKIDNLSLLPVIFTSEAGNNLIITEIKSFQFNFATWTVIITAFELSKKLNNKLTNYDPVTERGEIIQLKYDGANASSGIRNLRDAPWTVNEHQNLFLTVLPSTGPRYMKVYPNYNEDLSTIQIVDPTDPDESTTSVTGTVVGSEMFMYYDTGILVDDDAVSERADFNFFQISYDIGGSNKDFYCPIFFRFYADSLASIEKLVLNVKMRNNSGHTSLIRARIRLKNQTTGDLDYLWWEAPETKIRDIEFEQGRADYLDQAGQVEIIKVEFDKSTFDFADYIATSADGDDIRCIMEFKFYTGRSTGSTEEKGLVILETWVDIDFNVDQNVDFATRKIASNDTQEILINTDSMRNFFPLSDKWSARDEYFISDTLDTIMAAVWSQDGLWTLSFDTASNITDAQRLDHISLYELLRKYALKLNRLFWFEDFIIFSTSTFVSTGIELNHSDLVKNKSLFFKDYSNLRNTLTIAGSYFSENVKTLSPEKTVLHEEIFIMDPDVTTSGTAKDYADQQAPKYENSVKKFEVIIWYNDPAKDYSAIGIAKTIGLKIDDTGSILDYTSGGDGELVIKAIIYNQTNAFEFATLFLEEFST